MEFTYSKIMYNSVKHGCPSLVYMDEYIMNTQKHLTLDARTTIELELGKASSFKAIGQLLNKIVQPFLIVIVPDTLALF